MAPVEGMVLSPLSAWVRGLELWKWVTKIDLGNQVFEGHLPPAACDAILSAQRAGHPTPETPYRWADLLGSDDPESYADINQRQAAELADWWRRSAEAEIDQTVAKAIEYGATDLVDIGRNIARLSGRDVTDAEAASLGIFFYLEGKFARWRAAIIEGRRVSNDTLLDIGVYVRMAQRIQQVGSWPGVGEHTYQQNTYGEGPQ